MLKHSPQLAAGFSWGDRTLPGLAGCASRASYRAERHLPSPELVPGSSAGDKAAFNGVVQSADAVAGARQVVAGRGEIRLQPHGRFVVGNCFWKASRDLGQIVGHARIRQGMDDQVEDILSMSISSSASLNLLHFASVRGLEARAAEKLAGRQRKWTAFCEQSP
jgi:hypothetical protein